jgi:hypothetical protein
VGTGFPVNLTSSGPETAPRLIPLGAPVKSYLLRGSYVAQQGVLSFGPVITTRTLGRAVKRRVCRHRSKTSTLGCPCESYLLRESYVAQQGVSFLTSSGRVRFVLGFIHQCSDCLFCPLYVLVLRKYVFTYVVYV